LLSHVHDSCSGNSPVSEADIAGFIMRRFDEESLTTDHPPIVAANEHASDPHYSPEKGKDSFFKKGDVVLIDLWAKFKNPSNSIYADETWMGFLGEEVPDKVLEVWELVRDARKAGYKLAKERFDAGETVYGWEVDDATRKPIVDAGYGEYFIHRTGHSITTVDHGSGANIDNLETLESRPLIPNTIFSIEPGVYLPDFGVRSEFDVLVTKDGKITAAEGTDQDDLIKIKI